MTYVAIARTRRAKAVGESKSTIAKRAPGNPWSKGLAESINSTTTSVIDDEEFPKMETTNQSLTQVGVGTTVGIHMNVGCDKMHGPCPYFACGRVVALKSNAQRDVIAKVSLGWQLADGQPPLMFVPVNDLTPLAESHAPEFKTTPSSHIEASSNTGSSLSQRKPDVDAKTCNPVSQATAASTKSKILSISGGGLSSTQYVDADDDNENDWVTPDNIGGFLGQEGFTKAYQTVRHVERSFCWKSENKHAPVMTHFLLMLPCTRIATRSFQFPFLYPVSFLEFCLAYEWKR